MYIIFYFNQHIKKNIINDVLWIYISNITLALFFFHTTIIIFYFKTKFENICLSEKEQTRNSGFCLLKLLYKIGIDSINENVYAAAIAAA